MTDIDRKVVQFAAAKSQISPTMQMVESLVRDLSITDPANGYTEAQKREILGETLTKVIEAIDGGEITFSNSDARGATYGLLSRVFYLLNGRL